MAAKKPHLSAVEIAQLCAICEENGIAALIRFAAQQVAHKGRDNAWAAETRIALNKIANAVVCAPSRFGDETL